MGFCARCGRPIRSQYLYCYYCNQFAKTYKDGQGYIRFKDSDVPLHRYVAEKKLWRELRPGEVVHHKNRRKRDNRPSNLWVFPSQDDHEDAHIDDGDIYNRAYYRSSNLWVFPSQDDQQDSDEEDGDYEDDVDYKEGSDDYYEEDGDDY